MPYYHFEVSRSTEPADQVKGLTCKIAHCGGEADAPNPKALREMIFSTVQIPGTYTLRIRKGNRWLKPMTVVVEVIKK